MKKVKSTGKRLKGKNLIKDFVPKVKQKRQKPVVGVIDGTERGYAFLVTENLNEPDYFISEKDLGGANHKDVVQALIIDTGVKKQAKVVKIVKRGIEKLIGVYYRHKYNGFVIPDNRKYFNDIYIKSDAALNANDGDKVLVQITDYSSGKNPEGKILEVLGKQFETETEVKSIAAENFFLTFPDEVLLNAKKVAKPVSEKDLLYREDFTNNTIITIDGDDSKDFDDAVSVVKKGDNYILGVHIADVTHYVKRGSALDEEAFKRGTSLYFPEAVYPMLPALLSDDICSLKEGVNRLTLSAIMEIDKKGQIVKSRIVKGVIKSTARMTYKKVTAILQGDKDLIKTYAKIVPMIKEMDALAKILLKKRTQRGNVDLAVDEAEISVKDGKITVNKAERVFAYKIIEEFMIAANEAVAAFADENNLPFVYRVHEKPPAEKVERFSNFLNEYGIAVPFTAESVTPKDYQTAVETAKQKGIAVLSDIALRSMSKAKYHTEDLGHFGLASANYCHFTSPIRRYADLTIHRVLKAFLDSGKDGVVKYYDDVEKSAVQSSEREVMAEEAERKADDFYKMLFIKDYVGSEFDGVVSGVTSFGVFVKLENTVEGIIKVENIEGGPYEYNEKTLTLYDKVHTIRFGDKKRIKVIGIDYAKKRAEFMFV